MIQGRQLRSKSFNSKGSRESASAFVLLVLLLTASSFEKSVWAEDSSLEIRGEDAQSLRVSVPIEDIKIDGAGSISLQELEGAVELIPGEIFERSKLLRVLQRLREKYEENGFLSARVDAELKWNYPTDRPGTMPRSVGILFRVEEGSLSRVSTVDFEVFKSRQSGDSLFGEPIALSSRELEVWRAAFGLESGGAFSQSRLEQGRLSLQDYLATRDFLGVEIKGIAFEEVVAPKSFESLPQSNWVRLKVRVSLGDRVVIRFRGNDVFSYLDLKALVDEQRQLGLSGDYSGLLKAKVEEAYRKVGYLWTEVTPYFFQKKPGSARELLFVIREGELARMTGLTFDGNSVFSGDELRLMFRDQASGILRRGIYVEKDLDAALSGLIDTLKSKGYLGARMVNVSRKQTINSNGLREISVTAYLFEGDQTRVSSVDLRGGSFFSRDELMGELGVKEGAPFDLSGFSQGLESLKRKYDSEGFLDFKIRNESSADIVRYANENRNVSIYLDLEEGPRARVSKIDIEGPEDKERAFVARSVALKPGDYITQEKILDTQMSIQSLGVFPSVAIRTVPELDPELTQLYGEDATGLRRVKIVLQAGTPGIVAGGLGYRNDLGVRAFGQIGYTNLWSRNHTVALNGNVNKRLDTSFCESQSSLGGGQEGEDPCFLEYQLQLGYVWPWFIWGPTQLRPRLTLEKTQFLNFDAQTVGFAATLERRLLTQFNVVGQLTYSLENTRQFNAIEQVDNQALRIGSLVPSLRMDFRDSSLAPSRGLFLTSSFEWASTRLGSQRDPFPVGYTRYLGRADYYLPLWEGATWFFSLRSGFERNLEPPPESSPDDQRYAIPLIKQFALGGAGSLRGFNEQELNLQAYAISGTASYVNYRTQVDLPFSGAIRFGPFIDAANLLVDRFSFRDDLRVGAGVGFRYQSPVGPVNLDWGFKLNAREGEHPFRFYFSIGVI